MNRKSLRVLVVCVLVVSFFVLGILSSATRQEYGDLVPRIFLTMMFIGGIGIIASALLLKMKKVQPGGGWGDTPLGNLLLGCGLILLALGGSESLPSWTGWLGLLCFISSLIVNAKESRKPLVPYQITSIAPKSRPSDSAPK